MTGTTYELPSAAQLQPTQNCAHCGESFTPRVGTGGKPQKYCCAECRRAADSQRGPTRPTRDAAPQLALVESRENGEAPQEPPKTASDAPADHSGEIDWICDESVILKEQYSTAVYFNREGELVIVQRRWFDEDQTIFIAAEHVELFLDKLTDICGVPSFGKP
jgi:hypothetical protein